MLLTAWSAFIHWLSLHFSSDHVSWVKATAHSSKSHSREKRICQFLLLFNGDSCQDNAVVSKVTFTPKLLSQFAPSFITRQRIFWKWAAQSWSEVERHLEGRQILHTIILCVTVCTLLCIHMHTWISKPYKYKIQFTHTQYDLTAA